MNSKRIAELKERQDNQDTQTLLDIWVANDRNTNSDELFEAVRQTLIERNVDVPQQAVIVPESPPSAAQTMQEMTSELRKWGGGLLLIGALSLLMSEFLDPVWGVLLIIIGILSFIIRKSGMFIVTGCVLLIAGLMNILAGIQSGGWAVFGILQVVWAVQEFRKFGKFNKLLKQVPGQAGIFAEQCPPTLPGALADQSEGEGLTLSTNGENIMEQKHSGCGIASFVISIFMAVAIFFTMVIYSVLDGTSSGGIDEESMAAIVLGMFFLVFLLADLVALGLGIGGLYQKDRRKIFAVLGTVFSSVTILGTLFLIVAGSFM